MIKLIKKIFPKILINLGKKFVTFFAIKYYSTKYDPLIVRKNTSDPHIFRQIFVQRDHSFPIDIKPKLIIDAGAYVGYSSLYFSSKYPQAKIIAIEPENSNFEILEKNTKKIANIKRVKAGLWHKEGFLKIVNAGLGHWGFMTKEATGLGNCDVKAITVNILLKESGFDKIDILKLDIEGAEKELFSKNYKSWLDKVNILIIELHDRMKKGCAKSFYSAINGYSWKKFKRGANIILIKKDLGD